MARPRKPWYLASRGVGMVEIHGQQHKLARGHENRAEAERPWNDRKRRRDSHRGRTA